MRGGVRWRELEGGETKEGRRRGAGGGEPKEGRRRRGGVGGES